MTFHQPPHTYTGEVYLKVTDLEKLTAFYTEIIGFKVLSKETNRVSLTADGKQPLIVLEQPENIKPKEPRRTGLYHLALLLPTRADLGKAIKHFSRNQIQLGASDHLVSEALYLSDPDGNGIEIYRDRKPEEWEWHNDFVAMSTDPLDAQAIVAESGNEEWDGLPEGTVMGHVHLHVANLPETQAFYEALGFEVVTPYPQALFMSTGKYHHHIGLNTWNGAGAPSPSEDSAGLKAYTLVYPEQNTLGEAIKNIEALGGKVDKEDETFITKDPAGNGIVLRIHQ
ncbi:VOC family protein [Sporosarcina thermotolerans]|uniref:VOC family protein n=1 Tax=Sporosarcina thermotolerans TaxID=633404 RepID=A0AAW9A9D9_9BACL|nr:VOC family protein [Sporosarcina thermotolerans]MDW0118261.1 VOC family protein [Sporosarcina thermotolerans]